MPSMTHSAAAAAAAAAAADAVEMQEKDDTAKLFRRPSSLNTRIQHHQQQQQQHQRRRNGRVLRTNTVVGVTDQARRVLEELLARGGGGEGARGAVKREIPLSEPTPGRVFGDFGYSCLPSPLPPQPPPPQPPPPPPAAAAAEAIEDLASPLSELESDGEEQERPTTNGIADDKSSSAAEDAAPPPPPPHPHPLPPPPSHPPPNEEVTRRKKKSFFVRAKERLSESIRRQTTQEKLSSGRKTTEGEGEEKGKARTWSLGKRKDRVKKKKKKEKEKEEESWNWSSEEAVRSHSGSGVCIQCSDKSKAPKAVLPQSARISLPSQPPAFAFSQTKTAAARSQSTDETRIRVPNSDEIAFIRSRISKDQEKKKKKKREEEEDAATEQQNKSQLQNGNHSLRKNLQLEGLVVNYPAINRSSPAPLALPEDSRITPTDDEIDGHQHQQPQQPQQQQQHQWWTDRPLVYATSKPFDEKSEEERSELLSRIADQLDVIGDSYSFRPSNSNRRRPKNEDAQTDCSLGASNFEMQKAPSTSSLSDLANVVVGDLVRNTTYDVFQSVVDRTIGHEPGIQQIAAMFRLTKCAVNLAGAGTSAARRIKDMSIKYFAEHFASWMVDEGGWESVVEESATDMELD